MTKLYYRRGNHNRVLKAPKKWEYSSWVDPNTGALHFSMKTQYDMIIPSPKRKIIVNYFPIPQP